MKISVSFLKSKYEFAKTIELITKSNADLIHVDVTDGLFVNNRTTFNKNMLEVLKQSSKPKDIHLMTLHLKKYIDVFTTLNPEYITFAYEATSRPLEVIKYIKDKQVKVGISINPLTTIEEIKELLKEIDFIIVLAVNPGYGGQKFSKEVVEKIKTLKKIRTEKNYDFKIGIDGGISDQTIKEIDKELLDVIIAGSFICDSLDFNYQIDKLLMRNK